MGSYHCHSNSTIGRLAPINTNDETIPKVAENWGFLLGEFNYVQVTVNTIQTEIHSLLENPVLLFRLLEQQVLQRSYFPKISISQLRFNTNLLVLLVLLPTRPASTSSVQTGSAGSQHTVFGEEGAITIGISTANESITPFIPEGSGSLFTIGGGENPAPTYLVGDYQFISGAANVNFAPHITGVGTGTFSQGREPYQTYARKINIPDDEFGGTISLTGNTIFEKNTDSYNESSILFGTENEDYGLISVEDVGRGFSLSSLGIGLTSVESLDAADITFDNSQQTGLTYDESSWWSWRSSIVR